MHLQEAKQTTELMGRWETIDVCDALELLSPVFESEEVCVANGYLLNDIVSVETIIFLFFWIYFVRLLLSLAIHAFLWYYTHRFLYFIILSFHYLFPFFWVVEVGGWGTYASLFASLSNLMPELHYI